MLKSIMKELKDSVGNEYMPTELYGETLRHLQITPLSLN